MALWWALGPAAVHAGPIPAPVTLNQQNGRVDLATHAQVLEDPTAALSLAQVASQPWATRFHGQGRGNFHFQRPGAAYWVRFRLARPAGEPPGVWVLEVGDCFSHFFSQVDLYLPRPGIGGGYLRKMAGSDRPANPDGYRNRGIYLKIPPDFNSGAFIYLRISSQFSLSDRLSLWPLESLWAESLPRLLIPAMAYGALLAMLAYNLFILLSLRSLVYFYYTLYVGFTFLWQFFAQGYAHFFLDFSPGVFIRLDYLFGPLSAMFTVLLLRRFLDTGRFMPRLERALWVVMAGMALRVGLALAGLYRFSDPFGNLLGLAMTGLLISATVLRIRQGFRPARLLAPAWAFVTIGITVYLLQNLMIIPTNLWTSNAFLFGATLESLFLSFALAGRIKTLEREKSELASSERRYRNLSLTDGLTGLYSRRFFDEKLKSEVSLARELGHPLSLVVMDIDNFKAVNDNFGHPMGDKVLVALAEIVRGCVRESDVACRYGGEEFALILPYTSLGHSRAVAERIRVAFVECGFAVGARNLTCAVSLGLALLLESDTDAAELFKRADQALYQAKMEGKNRVVCARAGA